MASKKSTQYQDSLSSKEKMLAGTKIFVVRHGESEANVSGYHIRRPVLTKRGRMQSRMLGNQFLDLGTSFDVIVTSDKVRSKQTAEEIRSQMGKLLPIISTKELSEKDEGISHAGTADDFKERIEGFKELYHSLPEHQRWDYVPQLPGIDATVFETEREVALRMELALKLIGLAFAGKKILVVSHMLIMRAFLAHNPSTDQDLLKKRSRFSRIIPNCGFFEVQPRMVDGALLLDVTKDNTF